MRKSLLSKLRRSNGKKQEASTTSIDPTRTSTGDGGDGGDVASPSYLCSSCKNILRRIPNADSDRGIWSAFSHHSSTTKLWESVLNGCHLCSLIWRGGRFSGFRTRDTEKETDYTVEYSPDPFGVSNITLQIRWQDKMNGSQGGFVEVFGGRIPDFLRRAPSRVRENSTGSEESFKTAKKWLGSCQMLHSTCYVQQDEQRLKQPSRLISVTEKQGDIKLRLCSHSEYANDVVMYLTLSHCWGIEERLTLKKSNLEAFGKEIPFKMLPKTFADAMMVTLKLDHHYLWIDSLCILQDDETDWLHESPRMGDIYRNAVCNIAVLGAAGDHEGCFAKRAALGFQPLQLSIRSNNFYLEPPSIEQRRSVNQNLQGLPPLLTRGWVIQEVVLAPRTLYYGSELLFWECVECGSFELRPDLSDLSGEPGMETNKTKFAEFLNLRPNDENLGLLLGDLWRSVVTAYSATNLSHDSDKWLAISGLASEIGKHVDTSIIAGLWREDLLEHLRWQCNSPGRRINNSAPSWSWLSVTSRVSWSTAEVDDEMALEIVRLPEDCRSDLAYNEVSSSLTNNLPQYPLIVRGHLSPFRILRGSIESEGYQMISRHFYRDAPLVYDWQGFGLLYSHAFPLSGIVVLMIEPVDDSKHLWRRVGILYAEIAGMNVFDQLSRHSSGRMLRDFGPVTEIALI